MIFNKLLSWACRRLITLGPGYTVYLQSARYLTILLDFLLTVKAAPHECVIRTSQPKA